MEDEKKPKLEIRGESDMDKLNRFLITLAESRVGYRRKILMLKKYVDIVTGEKED